MVDMQLAQDREDGEAQTIDMEVTFDNKSEFRLLGPERHPKITLHVRKRGARFTLQSA